ncbi:DUF6879 family protein [Nonomuraea glycinis]|uniref:DUF6879 family protein n=1 Tax=Nonomuraea glycinis TaxID=2047744 RepID=UPI002E0FD35B|nr:DUF6879 family protein [Nonomuraea glycinis]WSG71179.1 hypothetical protein OHA68_17530 [Nonomuraea glycinis]
MTERPTFDELFAECTRSAVHLEMRDMYTPDDPVYLDWKAGVHIDPVERWREWYDLVVATVERGVEMRRARIVSEPITDFIQHEYDLTADLNIAAGEQVRWLSRRKASDLALPGNDFWVFDDRLVRFGHFSGDGAYLFQEITEEPAVVRLCVSAFESVWDRAVDHKDYRPS